MPGILFTNTLMLAGLAALAIPVIIHLLLKRKQKRLRFSTIQFFRIHDEKSSRRRKLRNLLLLSLRLLLVALLVTAFARPYLTQQSGAEGARQKQRVVFVLDASASMLATGTDGQRWELAKARMQKIVAGLDQNDMAALIVCAARADVVSGFAPPANLAHELATLQPGYGISNLGDGLRQALRLLSSAAADARTTVYVVSDLQRSACRGIAASPIPQNVEVKLLNVGDLHSPNLAITEFDARGHNGRKPQVALANFSDEDSPDIRLSVTIDGKEVTSTPVQLKAGSSTNIAVSFPPLRPGWHDALASIRSKDSLELDNTRYSCLFTPEPLRVLLVETRPGKHVFEQESFFLTAALDPTKDSTNSIPGTFNIVQVAPEELAGKLSEHGKEPAPEVVIVPGLREIPAGSAPALTSFVRAGGGLLLFLNDEVSVNRYNTEFRELLPAQLSKTEATPESGSPWRIGEYDTNTWVFAAFQLPNSGNLNIPEFNKRFNLTAGTGASLLAAFDDDTPLLLSRGLGSGRIVLANTSADTAWSDWPKHKTFVPWLHGLAKFLSQNPQHQEPQTNEFVAGEPLELQLRSMGSPSTFKLQGPGGEALLTCDNQGRLGADIALTTPGFYTLRDPKGVQVRHLAVNLPNQESDLEALAPSDFDRLLTRVLEPPKQTLASSLLGSSSSNREFWTALLAAALLLLLLEPIVANRTSA